MPLADDAAIKRAKLKYRKVAKVSPSNGMLDNSPLTLADAKVRLAAILGVAPDAIEITIRARQCANVRETHHAARQSYSSSKAIAGEADPYYRASASSGEAIHIEPHQALPCRCIQRH